MTIDPTKIRRGAFYEGIQRDKLPVAQSGSGTGNAVLTMDHLMREVYFANDDVNRSLTLNVSAADGSGDLEFVLRAYETINERLPEFEAITVTSEGAWRWYTRSGRIT